MYITNDLEIHTLDKLKVEMSKYIGSLISYANAYFFSKTSIRR